MPKSRRTYKRRYKRRKKSSGVTKKTVRTMVRRALRPTQNVVRLAAVQPPTGIASPYTWFHLNGIANSVKIFGATSNDAQANQAKHTSMCLDWTIRTGDEDDGCDITIYIVSPKNDVKDALFDAGTGLISLTNNEDYNIGNGAAYLNPRSFIIHRRYKVLFPARTSPTDPRFNLYKRRFLKLKTGHYIKNERGDWQSLHSPQKPSHNYYALVFNNNSSVDGEFPTFEYNVLNTYVC